MVFKPNSTRYLFSSEVIFNFFKNFLNYMKYNVTEANQILDIKIDRESLKEKLITKFKKTPEKVDELIKQYDIISSQKNNFDVYLICNNLPFSF